MLGSQFDLITFEDDPSKRVRPRAKPAPPQPPTSSSENESAEDSSSSKRSNYVDLEDRELAKALKRIDKLSAEIRANEDAETHARSLRERIDAAKRTAVTTISQLNDKMDAIEQAWDDQIIAEQKEIAKEVLSILKDLKEDELSQALTWKKRSKRSGRSSGSSIRSTSASRSQSASSVGSGSSARSSSMSKKIAHLDKKEREFAEKAAIVKKDATQLDAMTRNLNSINELERVVCSKLGRLQSVGDAKPGSAVYGTVELVDNYRMTVEHLANAIRSLSSVACLPAITNDDPITKAEIDKVIGAMSEFMGRIKAQLTSNGPSAESTSRPQTSVRVAQRSSGRGAVAASSEESGASYESARGTAPSSSSSSTGPTTGASTAKSIESHQG